MGACKKTLYEYFSALADSRPCDRFLFSEEQSYTVLQAFETTCALAEQFRRCGIDAGTHVAMRAVRSVDTILAFFALQFIGAVAVLTDPRDAVSFERFAFKGHVLTVEGRDICLDYTARVSAVPVPEDSTLPTIVIFTSGSTGEPKAVRLSQYNFINNSLDTAYIGGYAPDDINIDIVPIHHVFGLALIFTAVVTGHAIFVPGSIEADYIAGCIIKYGATRLNGVPSLYLAIAESPLACRIKSLRCGLIGGAPCSREQFIKVEKRLGLTLIPVYGMSECIGISCGDVHDPVELRCGSVGRVYSMNSVKFADDGEILVRSPAMAAGVADEDGFLHTGDLGYIDKNGYMHVSGRKKDIIIRNGNNLSAVAIEQKLLRLPQVRDVCVVGVRDEREGEVPAAAIVLHAGQNLSRESICSALIKIEIPKYVGIVAEIPLTSSCKPDKQKVLAKFFGNSACCDSTILRL